MAIIIVRCPRTQDSDFRLTVSLSCETSPGMYTADDARRGNQDDLDARIKRAVEGNACGSSAHIRVYHDDPWRYTIQEDLEERGFTNVYVPDIILSGDVYFEWA